MLPEGLSLAYQPIICAASGRLVAVEALLRTPGASAAPLKILANAASSGCAEQLDRAVVESACGQVRSWRERGLLVPVHVNISAATAHSGGGARFAAWLSQLSVAEGAITIELTETTKVRGLGPLVRFAEACRTSGFEVALDDFGCGYSTLELLQRLRADIVKIDRRFVAVLAEDPWTRSIVQHMIALAQDLGMRVIGEGVERNTEAAWLRRMGCDEFQGYAFARPMNGDALANWVADRTAALVSGTPAPRPQRSRMPAVQ